MSSKKNAIALVVLAGVAAMFMRTTLAANISLGSGNVREFGQGIQVLAACSGSNSITMTPGSSFANVSNAGAYKFNTLTVSDIPTSCYGSVFTFSAYDSATASALPLYGNSATSFVVHDWNGTFYSPGSQSGIVVTTNSTTSFTATFTTPISASTNVFRLTIQSEKSTITLTCVIAGSTCTFTARDIQRNFVVVTSSDDGQILYAGEDGGPLYKSSNYGATWSQLPITGNHWYALDTSDDGSKIVAAGLVSDTIYTSTDSGATWTVRSGAGTRNWHAVAISGDGTKMIALPESGYLYLSTDSGATWAQQTSAGSRTWYGISMSKDGSKLVALTSGGASSMWTSINGGGTWTSRSTPTGTPSWRAAASSNDGSVILASASAGSLWRSTDFGATWVELTDAGTRNWNPVDISGDGNVMVAGVGAGSNGQIYSSVNGGASWFLMSGSPSNKSWTGLALSDDGGRLVASAQSSNLYTTGG